MIFRTNLLQGLSEQALNAFRLMRGDGLKPSLLALNSLINAFGEDKRDAEAFAVLQYMKDNVTCFLILFTLTDPFLSYCRVNAFNKQNFSHCLTRTPLGFLIIAGLETRCCHIYHADESFESSREI